MIAASVLAHAQSRGAAEDLSIFPAAVTAGQRPGWFVNVTDDSWFGPWAGPQQHFLIARVRAIEEGLPIARAANTGISAMIDPLGRVVARVPRKQRIALVAPYALTSVTTFYTRYGDWFAYACAIISMGALFRRVPSLKQKQKAKISS